MATCSGRGSAQVPRPACSLNSRPLTYQPSGPTAHQRCIAQPFAWPAGRPGGRRLGICRTYPEPETEKERSPIDFPQARVTHGCVILLSSWLARDVLCKLMTCCLKPHTRVWALVSLRLVPLKQTAF